MLYLASKSPRRRELLAGLGFSFQVISADADESYPATLSGGDIPLYISRAKARACASMLQAGDVLLAADTIVWVEGEVLGKPHDAADAARMLRLLSGCTHQVYTGFTIIKDGVEHSGVDCTDVTFRTLTDAEIDYYIREYAPFDKAGAYGIQEWIGYAACTGLRGSYFNVMGLPTEPIYAVLQTAVQ